MRMHSTVLFASGVGLALTWSPALRAEPPTSQAIPLPTNAAARIMMTPVSLEKLGHAPLAGPAADLGGGLALAEGALPYGPVEVDGTPFRLVSNGLDIATSLADLTEPFRVKHGLLGPFVTAVPVDQYAALHLLAFSRVMDGAVPSLTVRLGFNYLFDEANTVIDIPDIRTGAPARDVVSRVPVKLRDGSQGWLYHIRSPIPHSANITWDMKTPTMNMEFTRSVRTRVNLPDPNEFGFAPAGPPSSAVLLAATLERSPVKASYANVEAGNIFFDTQTPVFLVNVSNRTPERVSGVALAQCSGPGPEEEARADRTTWTVKAAYSLKPGQGKVVSLNVKPPRNTRGWYGCMVEVQIDGQAIQKRNTSFAVIAPDTRKAQDDSPFGTWVWIGATHASLAPPDISARLGSIIRKGGWRWSMVEGAPAYKLRLTAVGLPNCYQRPPGWFDEAGFQKDVLPALKAARTNNVDQVFKVMHEARSSLDIVRRLTESLGGAPYTMPPAEKALFETQYSNVVAYCRALKQAEPGIRIILINDYPHIGIEFMKRGMPKELFDIFGSEGANFLREPERQPDWLCLMNLCQSWNRAKKEYGYEDKPVWFTEALYHSTNPGGLTYYKQAVIYVREAMLALANGVERLGSMGTPRDYTSDYRQTQWGCTGFCGRDPEFPAKPSFAMFAWLTQLLDQAAYSGFVKSDSTSLHVLDFVKKDGSHIFPVWVARGRQTVTLACADGKPVVFDGYGNTVPARARDGRIEVTATETPLYVAGTRVTAVAGRQPMEVPRAGGELLADFDKAGPAAIVAQPSKILEGNWDFPRLKGSFSAEGVSEDGATALKVTLQPDADARTLLQRYVELPFDKPIPLPGRPSALTLRVKGNGGWGKIMFELTDAKGRVWTSCGNQNRGAVNASDPKGDAFVSFDGWQTMVVPLPGQYPGKDQFVVWPDNYNWWPVNTPEQVAALKAFEEAKAAHPQKIRDYQEALKAHGQAQADYALKLKDYEQRKAAKAKDLGSPPAKPEAKPPVEPAAPAEPRETGIARVDYPLKLTKLIVAMPPHILYVNGEVPVANPSICIDNIKAEQAAPGL